MASAVPVFTITISHRLSRPQSLAPFPTSLARGDVDGAHAMLTALSARTGDETTELILRPRQPRSTVSERLHLGNDRSILRKLLAGLESPPLSRRRGGGLVRGNALLSRNSFPALVSTIGDPRFRNLVSGPRRPRLPIPSASWLLSKRKTSRVDR
jgi:hypothetical protein